MGVIRRNFFLFKVAHTTDRHRDIETELAQWADLVKMLFFKLPFIVMFFIPLFFSKGK